MIKVTVWNEYLHERDEARVRDIYPEGIHNAIADFLRCEEIAVKTATLEDEACGLTDEALSETDVLIWWGHMGHERVPDEVATRVQNAGLGGMGAVFLHSAHNSKPFRLLMGTSCNLSWREDGDRVRLWVVDPSHPIARGLGRYIEIANDETYSEPFSVPEPDKLVFISSFEGGEVFRGGCCFQRGYGKIFYFQPGHETFPVFYNKDVQTVIQNAVRWAKPEYRSDDLSCPNIKKLKE
jgi:trehalose utilization protein